MIDIDKSKYSFLAEHITRQEAFELIKIINEDYDHIRVHVDRQTGWYQLMAWTDHQGE